MEQLKAEIKEIEGNVRQLDQERESIQHNIEQMTNKRNSRQSEQKNMESLLNTELEKLRLVTDKHTQAHRRLEEMMAEINEARKKFDELIKFELNIRTKIENEKIKSNELFEQISEKEELLNELQRELEDQQNEQNELAKELDSLQSQIKLHDIQKRVYINQTAELTEQCKQLKNDHFGLSNGMFEINFQIEKLVQERDCHVRWIEELAASKQTATDRLTALDEELCSLKSSHKERVESIASLQNEIARIQLARQNSSAIRDMIINSHSLFQKMLNEYDNFQKVEEHFNTFERTNMQLEEEIREIRQTIVKEKIELLTLENENTILTEVRRRLNTELSQVSTTRRDFAKQPNIFDQIDQIKEDFAIEVAEDLRSSINERKASFPERESPHQNFRDFFKQISNDATEHPGNDKDEPLLNPISPTQDPFANDNSLISNHYLTQPRAESRRQILIGNSSKHILSNLNLRPIENSQRFIREYEAFEAEINRKSKFSAVNDRDLSSSRLTHNKTQKHQKMHSTDSLSKFMGMPEDDSPEKRELMLEWSGIVKCVTRVVTFMLKTSSIFANSITLIVSKYQKDDKRCQAIRSHIVKSANQVLQGLA